MKKALIGCIAFFMILLNLPWPANPTDLPVSGGSNLSLTAVYSSMSLISGALSAPPPTPEPVPVPASLEEKQKMAVIYRIDSALACARGNWTLIDKTNSKVTPLLMDNVLVVPLKPFVDAFGGELSYDGVKMEATIRYRNSVIQVQANSSFMKINQFTQRMAWTPRFIHGRLYISLASIASAMDKKLVKDESGLIIVSDADNLFDPIVNRPMLREINNRFTAKPISFRTETVKTSGGSFSVRVITVNPKDPRIAMSVDIPDRRFGVTRNFDRLVAEKGAYAAINANFFYSGNTTKNPIGNIMVNGRILHGQSGITTIGVTKSKDIVFSNVSTFYKGKTDGKSYNADLGGGRIEYNQWVAYEINSISQNPGNIIIYTPEFGTSLPITSDGYVAVVERGVVTRNTFIAKGGSSAIPANGYVVYFGQSEGDRFKGHLALQVGRKAEYTHYVAESSNPGFLWEEMQFAIAGGPDLVINGQMQPPSTLPMFSAEKFKSLPAPRTAIGMTADGLLLLVNVPKARIGDLKEIMKSLGAWQAVNLDGGASTGMSYEGKTVYKPGREIVAMFYVYYNR